MNKRKLMNYMNAFGLTVALIALTCAIQRQRVFAQTPASSAGQTSEDDQFFKGIYREFYDTYGSAPPTRLRFA